MHPLTIIKKGDPTPLGTLVVYCGRGSALGNPHVMRGKSEAERNRVCDLYAADFPTPEQEAECDRIMGKLETQSVAMECFCVPKRCHCETPRDYILKNITI